MKTFIIMLIISVLATLLCVNAIPESIYNHWVDGTALTQMEMLLCKTIIFVSILATIIIGMGSFVSFMEKQATKSGPAFY